MNGKKLGSDQNISSTGQIIASWAIINWLQVLYRLLWMTSAMIYDVTYNSSSKCVPLLTMFILFNSARIFFKYMSKRLKKYGHYNCRIIYNIWRHNREASVTKIHPWYLFISTLLDGPDLVVPSLWFGTWLLYTVSFYRPTMLAHHEGNNSQT